MFTFSSIFHCNNYEYNVYIPYYFLTLHEAKIISKGVSGLHLRRICKICICFQNDENEDIQRK